MNNSPLPQFIPSKKIFWSLGVVSIFLLIIIGKPWRWIPQPEAPVVTPLVVTPVIAPPGNPITRDSNNNGIPDWKDFAETFSFNENISLDQTQVPDTDKISYTIFDKVAQQSSLGQELTDEMLTKTIQEEVYAYMKDLAPDPIYTIGVNLTTVPTTPESLALYKKQVAAITPVDVLNEDFSQKIFAYLTRGEYEKTILAKTTEIQSVLTKASAIPLPESLAPHQEIIFNNLYRLTVLLKNKPYLNTDPLYTYAHQVLIYSVFNEIIQESALIQKNYE